MGNRVSLSQHQLFGKLKITPVQPSVLHIKVLLVAEIRTVVLQSLSWILALEDPMGYNMPGSSIPPLSPGMDSIHMH